MILKQYYLACLSQASYLLGDEETRTAVIVDPTRDVDQYVEDATALGLDIRHVFLTHFHADFASGHLELRERTGAEIHLGARGETEFPVTPARDGDVLDFGKLRLRILETPGHTPESICIVVHDLAGAEAPHAILTGDTLFLGDVGRPDLMASVGVAPEDLAGQLFDSLHEKILPLPDATLVYPGHGAGSACGKNLSTDTVSTLGEQRRLNYALQPMTREEFVRLVTADQPDAPAYFAHDAMFNRREHPTLTESLKKALQPRDLAEVIDLVEAGACVLDSRDADAWAAAHLAGSVNVGLGGKFASWAGSVLDREHPIVLVTDAGREEEAAMRLGRIGFDHVVGYVRGGAGAFADRPDLVRKTERVTPEELASRLGSASPPILLDVRAPGECRAIAIEGSVEIPLARLRNRIAEVPDGRPIVVLCASGYRSSIGASLLEGAGRSAVADLAGGLTAWQETGHATTASADAG